MTIETQLKQRVRMPNWLKWFIIISFVGGIVVAYNYSLVRARMMKDARNIPPVKELPAFSLTDQNNRTVTKADLLGDVWLANFIFTRCPGPCTTLSKTMAGFQDKLAQTPGVKIVSITVDPEHDTPEELAAYAARFQADPERWLFLTGPKEELLPLILKGFMLPVADNEPERVETEGLFIHSTRVVLIDPKGMIRGYYDTESPQAVEKLFGDIPFLRDQYPREPK